MNILNTDYNNNIDEVTNNISMDIVQRGTSISNGLELATTYCSKIIDPRTNTTGCTGQELSILNRTINNLPIYFIIAHSNIDLNFKRQNNQLVLKNSPKLFKTLDIYSDLSESKFIVNTTTAGGWGLLDEKSSCIPVGHLLKTDSLALHNYFFNPDINCEERITIWSTKETDRGRDLEKPDFRYPPLFNIPGSKYIDKSHQFGGNKLSGGGFGIIKMSGQSGTKAIDAISKWEKKHPDGDESTFEDNVYFLSDIGGDLNEKNNNGFSDKDKDLYELLRNNWTIDTYVDDESEDGLVDMGASNVTLSNIISTGGPGIYVSLSCSEYFVDFPDKRLIDYNPNSPDIILTSSIDQAFQTVGAINREQWDIFTKGIKYAVKRSRGVADDAPSATTLLADERSDSLTIGPVGVENRKRTYDKPAAIAQLRNIESKKKRLFGGRRKTRRRKKKTVHNRKKKRKNTRKRKTRKTNKK